MGAWQTEGEGSFFVSLTSLKILSFENTQIKIWYFTHLFVSLYPKNKNQKLCQSTQTISNG